MFDRHKKLLQIILTVACRPRILLLDEPTTSLDPVARSRVLDMIMDYMQDEDNTTVFSTHLTADLDKVADYVVLIQDGKIAFNKEKEALAAEYESRLGFIPTIEDVCLAEDDRGRA